MGCELVPGSQHSQKDFIGFFRSTLHRSRRLTQAPILVRLDSAHDAEENRIDLVENSDLIENENTRAQSLTNSTEWLRQANHHQTINKLIAVFYDNHSRARIISVGNKITVDGYRL